MVDAIFFACGEIGTLCINGTVNDIFVTYDYTFDENEDKLSLSYNSNFTDIGTLRILIPWSKETDKKEWLERNLEVQIDGNQTDFKFVTINNDSFVVIETDFHNRTARVSMNLNQ